MSDKRRTNLSSVSPFKTDTQNKNKRKVRQHKLNIANKPKSTLTVDLYSISKKKVVQIPQVEAMYKLYYLEVRPATASELKSTKSKFTTDEIRELISSQDSDIPLYDVYTSNIYLIQRRNVYRRVINNNYRFPDSILMDKIQKDRDRLETKLKTQPEKYRKDMIFQKKLRRATLMTDFISYFDMDVLFNTYLRVFYLYAPEISNQTYTCLRKSFIPHKDHLQPYYTRDEVIRLAMNNNLIVIPKNTTYDDFRDSMSDSDFSDLCYQIQANDMSATTLLSHQNYIIQNNSVGLVQYYTVQGSYFINQYMRKMTIYEYQNDYLENIIDQMWRLVLNAPAFDNDYILYRFVSNDSYLSHLEVGDFYSDPGFTSTTRDPFYRTDLYQFGFILIKIRVPKGVQGVGLCLETLSHFSNEEEVILAPMARLKLVAKTDASDYYHPDKNFVSEVKKGYEFEFVGNTDVELSDSKSKLPFPKRIKYDGETKVVNFLDLVKPKTFSLRERVRRLMNNEFDPMNRIKCKIGDQEFYVVGEYYNSVGPYEQMYAITSSEGFSLYSIYNGYVLFMIEIGEENKNRQIRVNYFTKYSELRRDDIMGDDNFIEFISSIAYYFDIPNIFIYADYHSCDHLEADIENKKQIGGAKDHEMTLKVLDAIRRQKRTQNKSLSQRTFQSKADIKAAKTMSKTESKPKTKTKTKTEPKTKTKTEPKTVIDKHWNQSDIIEEPEFTGGSYCLDFYRYFKHGVRRYEDTKTLNIELRSKFDYRDLDVMKSISPSTVLSPRDGDELYQIYRKAYLLEISKDLDNLADFYIWMIENKCYLMDIFVSKLNRLYKDRNPFKKGYYILDGMTYLYNRSKISSFNRFIKMDIDEDHDLLVIPKNDYRIVRGQETLR
jgi:hypothetical protein